MNTAFKHFLITRYNVRLDHWEKDLHGNPTLEDEWMIHRYELFSRYCFPSVLAQSEKNFCWLIYFESSTLPAHLKQINSLVNAYPFIQIRLVKGYDGCMKDIDDELTKAPSEYVITSRLDNDDAIGIAYIKTIQSHFIPQDKTLINLLHGYSYTPGQHLATRLFHIQRNSFSSFIEERRLTGGHISVRGFPHGNPPSGTIEVEIDFKYSWLKVFHERNLLSTLFGYPVFNDYFKSQYGIEEKYLSINRMSTLRYVIPWLWDGGQRKINKIFSSKK